MRIGIFGGSFDPVHLAHLWIGQAAWESLSLDRLLWIPSRTQPLKPNGPVASNSQRTEMLRLALAGRSGFEVDEREIRREGVSYSVDTVAELKSEFPRDDLFLIVGSDSLASMRQWHAPEKLLNLASLAVVQRGGETEIDFTVLSGMVSEERIAEFRSLVIPMPLIEISSSEIRLRVEQGRSIRYLVPHPVESYIGANQLYGRTHHEPSAT